MNNTQYTLRYLDCCLPDYFQGSSNPVIAVPVDGNTTYQDLKEAIELEYNSSDEYPDTDIKTLLADFFTTSGLNQKAFARLEPYNEIDDSVYMYMDIS